MKSSAYFIADTHLRGDGSADDRRREAGVCRWLEDTASGGAELWMLGDMLDYWYEYKTVVPRGHVRLFGALARLADAGVRLRYIVGNHDIWLRDYLRDEIGMEVLDGVVERDILGTPFVLCHGDGLGPQRRGFKSMRRVFRNGAAQWLFSGIHPRWTVPLARRWSAYSRRTGETPPSEVPGEIMLWAGEYCDTHRPRPRYFVMGHMHTPLRRKVEGADAEVVVLGDCLDGMSWGVFDGRKLSLEFRD